MFQLHGNQTEVQHTQLDKSLGPPEGNDSSEKNRFIVFVKSNQFTPQVDVMISVASVIYFPPSFWIKESITRLHLHWSNKCSQNKHKH